MKRLIFLFGIVVSLQSYAQNYLMTFQGKWEGNNTTDPNTTMKYWSIIKENKKLSLSFDSYQIVHADWNIVGFLNEEKDTIRLNQLKSSGEYFYFCTLSNNELICNSINTFDPLEPSYYFGNTSIYEFHKVDTFPIYVYKGLFNWDKNNKTNYSKDFLGIPLMMINESKANIYSSPDKISNQYLIKGDLVQILTIQDDWYKIRFYGEKLVEGWVKKSYLGEIHTSNNKPLKIVKVPKSIIYEKINVKGSMYLVKGDKVQIIEEKADWLRIRYQGKKVVEGWIKKADVE